MRANSTIDAARLAALSWLSSAAGWAARSPLPPAAHRVAIRGFARHHRIDAVDARSYRTFAEFFARPGGCPAADPGDDVVTSPVDGRVVQAGVVTEGECIQAKGIRFRLDHLLGCAGAARALDGGSFATLYLSPRDYHRVHAPLAGTVDAATAIPGHRWPVKPTAVARRENLYTLNERLVAHLATAAGRCAVVMVGATCVSRIVPTFLEPPGGRRRVTLHQTLEHPVRKGDELARFELGSTVVLVFAPGSVRWDDSLAPGAEVRAGRRIGQTV